jgi:hypothetical protein
MAKDRSAKALSVTAPVSEFKEFPDVLVSFPKVRLVGRFGDGPSQALDVRKEPSAADVALPDRSNSRW